MKALSLLIFTIFLPTAFSLAKKTTLPLVAKLIHHNSIESPFFDPNVTPENQHKRETENFLAYLSKLKLQSQGNFEDEKFRAEVSTHLEFPIFLVQFQIGEPPVYQAAALDTGSSHFWIHCFPCEGCVDLYYPLYDPEESPTYEDLGCQHYLCSDGCKNEHQKCEFFKNYVTGYSKGLYAYEGFTFSYNSTQQYLSRIVFGCSHKSKDIKFSGILGLGMDQISLLSQVGAPQFAYCLGNLSDPRYEDNVLFIKEEPMFDGTTTPLLEDVSHYFTNLEAISVGGEFLDINEEDLRRTSDSTVGGAIFDSGASTSLLQGIAYKELEKKVMDVIGNLLKRVDDRNNRLCFEGDLQRDFNSFPTVRFHFAGGGIMEFDKENIFKQVWDAKVCLNVQNADNYHLDVNLIGVNLQQYFYVEFDIKNRRIGFQRMDCNALWN